MASANEKPLAVTSDGKIKKTALGGVERFRTLAMRRAAYARLPNALERLADIAEGKDVPGLPADKVSPEMRLACLFKFADKVYPNAKPESTMELDQKEADASDMGDQSNADINAARRVAARIASIGSAQRSGSGLDAGLAPDTGPGETVHRPLEPALGLDGGSGGPGVRENPDGGQDNPDSGTV